MKFPRHQIQYQGSKTHQEQKHRYTAVHSNSQTRPWEKGWNRPFSSSKNSHGQSVVKISSICMKQLLGKTRKWTYYAKPWLFSLSLIASLMFCFILSGWGASRWIWSSSASKKLINEHCILRFHNPLPLKLFCKSITVWCYRYIFVISFCTSEYSGISENKQN